MEKPDRDPEAWLSIAVEMLDSTDSKSAARVFGPIEGYVVKLAVEGQPSRDVKVLEVGATDGEVCGFLVRPVDSEGQEVSCDDVPVPGELIPYETVQAIGIY